MVWFAIHFFDRDVIVFPDIFGDLSESDEQAQVVRKADKRRTAEPAPLSACTFQSRSLRLATQPWPFSSHSSPALEAGAFCSFLVKRLGPAIKSRGDRVTSARGDRVTSARGDTKASACHPAT